MGWWWGHPKKMMIQWLRAFATLVENIGSVSRTHMEVS